MGDCIVASNDTVMLLPTMAGWMTVRTRGTPSTTAATALLLLCVRTSLVTLGSFNRLATMGSASASKSCCSTAAISDVVTHATFTSLDRRFVSCTPARARAHTDHTPMSDEATCNGGRSAWLGKAACEAARQGSRRRCGAHAATYMLAHAVTQGHHAGQEARKRRATT